MGPASNPPSYPSTTISSDPYQKLPLASSGYSAESQDMPPHLPTTMPSMQLSMITSEQPGHQQASGGSSQVPPIRTQYTYEGTPTALPSLSASTSNLSVPRYVDDANPRPTKSPRHPSHPSIQGSISSTESASNEYRYGAPAYGSISSASADNISPSTATHGHGQPHTYHPSAAGGASQQHETGAPSGATAGHAPPPRDYYPSAAPWTSTTGESSAPTYSNGDHRASYPYSSDQYKTAGVKSDPHAPPTPVYPGQAMNNYSWSPS